MLGIAVHSYTIAAPGDADALLKDLAASSPTTIEVLPSPLMQPNVPRLAELALRRRLPSISPFRGFTEQGLLLSYGADIRDIERQAAAYVDRILKGARPGDLPVERPTRFELVVNTRTAKAIGVTVPGSMLTRADEIIS